MSEYQTVVCNYQWLIRAYKQDPDIFMRLAHNDTKFKDMGASLTDAMFKLGRGCFTLEAEHADSRTDGENDFDLNGVYRLAEGIIAKAEVFPVNNVWHFAFPGQLYRLHEAPSIVGYLGVEFIVGERSIPIKSLAASITKDGVNIDPVTASLALVSPMPAIPESVLFFMPLMQMLREPSGKHD